MTEDPKPKCLILVVDDDPSDLRLMTRILTKNDYEVKTAKDAAEALRVALECIPTMVISDVGLPGMSGIDLCAQMKGYASLERIPVVFLSGHDSPNDYRAGREVGGVFYVSKNRGLDNLMTVVNALCAVRKNPPSNSPSTEKKTEHEVYHRSTVVRQS